MVHVIPRMNSLVSNTFQLCVLTDQPSVRKEFEDKSCPSVTVSFHSLGAALETAFTAEGLSELLRDDARRSHVVLIDWNTLRAPLIGTLCRHLRRLQVPLVAMTDGGESDHIAALAVGADRVLPLPPSLNMLRAQVASHRRISANYAVKLIASNSRDSDRHSGSRYLRFGSLVLDRSAEALYADGEEVAIKGRQLGVLACLMANPNVVLSRDQILNSAWGIDFDPGTNTIDVHVHHLRRTLAELGFGQVIRTVRGRGYRFVARADSTKLRNGFNGTDRAEIARAVVAY